MLAHTSALAQGLGHLVAAHADDDGLAHERVVPPRTSEVHAVRVKEWDVKVNGVVADEEPVGLQQGFYRLWYYSVWRLDDSQRAGPVAVELYDGEAVLPRAEPRGLGVKPNDVVLLKKAGSLGGVTNYAVALDLRSTVCHV